MAAAAYVTSEVDDATQLRALREIPPKLESPACGSLEAYLAQEAEANAGVLLDELSDLESTEQREPPMLYRRADIANHVLELRFGRLDEELSLRRREVADDDELAMHFVRVRSAWERVLSAPAASRVRFECVADHSESRGAVLRFIEPIFGAALE